MSGLVLATVSDRVAVVTLNRPAAMNALSRELRAEFGAVLLSCEANPEVRAIVLTGAGNRAFSAGLDRKDLPGEMADVVSDRPTSTATDPALAVATCRIPVVAAVNGIAMTGGLELMVACDFAVASETARFADTHARLGLVSMWGLSQRLPRRIGQARAIQMSLTGEVVDASRALAWGLINEIVPPDRVLDRAVEIARMIAIPSRRTVMTAKRLIDEGGGTTLAQGLAFEQREARAFVRSTTAMRAEVRK